MTGRQGAGLVATMDWRRLMAATRQQDDRAEQQGDARSAFERDNSRLLFANAFRRLHNKTQVFPMPENDHVHSRLTHSLEVANVGRSLGKLVGNVLVERYDLAERLAAQDFAEVLGAACLAHDLGNPPFGHAGEDAIGNFFQRHPDYLAGLGPSAADDLRQFEGNAQGFRLLSRLCMYRDQGGMRLTAAALGAFSKYPQGSPTRGDKQRAGGKKFGFFQAEAAAFTWVAETCGLLPVPDVEAAWFRHPLAFLMEAADDICYHILDLEDGVMVRLLSARQMAEAVAPILDRPVDELTARPPAALRGAAINVLVQQVVDCFLANEVAMRAGAFQTSLTDSIPAGPILEHIYDNINMPYLYRSTVALDLEQTGFNVIGGLLENLCSALFDDRHGRLLQMLPDHDVFQTYEDPYLRLLHLTDYVSGMTDRYALRRYRGWTGSELRSV